VCFEIVSERHRAAYPHAFSLRGGNLVSDSFSSDFPFKLREGKRIFTLTSGPHGRKNLPFVHVVGQDFLNRMAGKEVDRIPKARTFGYIIPETKNLPPR
jgi:hypothetical protein